MRRISLAGAAGCLLMLAACSTVSHRSGDAAPAGGRPSAGVTISTSPTGAVGRASATPGPGTTTTSAPATKAATGGVLVPMQTPQGGEFRSPSGNISCEVNYKRSGLTGAYCQTGTPPRSVTMDATGAYKTCTGVQCLGDAGEGTPTLAYGQATGVGPFRCESASTGVTCTAGGKGFHIDNSGVTSAP